MSQPSQPSFYAIIPATVRYCKNLECGAKLLYGEITALCSQEGYCWATNKYLANLYDVDTKTIQRWIASLRNENFIVVEVDMEGLQTIRKIWISPEIKIISTERQKCHGGVIRTSTPPDKNVLHINTSITTSIKESLVPPPSAVGLAELLLSHILKVHPKFKAPKDLKEWSLSLDRMVRIDNRTEEDIRKLITWIFENPSGEFWRSNIQSGKKLREKFDQIWMKAMGTKDVVSPQKEVNRKLALQAQKILLDGGRADLIKMYAHSVFCVRRKEHLYFDMNIEDFKKLLYIYFQLED